MARYWLRRGSRNALRAGFGLAATLALVAATALPLMPQDWHLRVLAPGWMPHQLVQLLEYSNDIQVAFVADRPLDPHPRIALVLINDDTLADYPYVSPIDRELMSRLVKALDGLGARAIGLDILFDQPTEPAKDTRLLETFRLTHTPVVLGGADERTPMTPRRRAWQTQFLGTAALPFGFFNLRYDVREAARTHVIRNRALPHPGSAFDVSFAEALARQVGVRSLPASRRIPWLRSPDRGGDTFLSVDAESILAADREPDGILSRTLEDQLQGRVVLVGADIDGKDRHSTPLSVVSGQDMLGVAVHAQILAALLDGRALSDVAPSTVAALGALATFLGGLIGWFAGRRRLVLTILIACGTLSIMGLSAIVLWQFQAIVPVAAIVAALVAAAMSGRIARVWLGY